MIDKLTLEKKMFANSREKKFLECADTQTIIYDVAEDGRSIEKKSQRF